MEERSESRSRQSRKSKAINESRTTDAALASELFDKLKTSSSTTESQHAAADEYEAKEAAKRNRRNKYGTKQVKEAAPVVGLTDEQRLRAMLGYGYGDAASSDLPAHLVLEYICACCGTEHKAPHLLDAYYLCQSCQNCLRDPSALRKRWADITPECKLEICYATYGDDFEPLLAYEITPLLQARVDEIYYRDRLSIRKVSDLAAWFAPLAPPQWPTGDPSPGKNKQIKIRYRMLGLHGTLNLDVMPDNKLSSNFMMIAPKEKRYLRIIMATYGHPKGS